MAHFTPPRTSYAPTFFPSKGNLGGNAVMRNLKNETPVADNVYILNDNTVTTTQPLWTDVKAWFQGGASHILTGEQIGLLIAAGYASSITYP